VKLTPWFPAKVKPVKVGVYQSKKPFLSWYRYWDGEYWHSGGTTPMAAKNYANMAGSRFDETPPEPWRGLAEEPK
jgi:hypothetical protein